MALREKEKSYFYYPSVGGAFRILLMQDNHCGVHLPPASNITPWEEEFVRRFKSFDYGRVKSAENMVGPIFCEWYKAEPELLQILSPYRDRICDRYGNRFTLNNLKQVIQATNYIENKVNFYNIIQKLNPENLVETGILTTLEKLTEYSPFPIIVKSSKGKGGKGNFVCYQPSDIKILSRIFRSALFRQKQENGKRSFRVISEPYLEKSKSYNVSYYCDSRGHLHDISVSEQIIEEVFYRGNKFPAILSVSLRRKVTEFVYRFNDYLFRQKGFWGWMGIDFIVKDKKLYFIEANPRVNSVTHAHRLTRGNPFIIRLLQKSDLNKLLKLSYWDTARHIGIMPYQILSETSFLVISSAPTRWKASSQLAQFIKLGKFQAIRQRRIGNYTKSISYYIERLPCFVSNSAAGHP